MEAAVFVCVVPALLLGPGCYTKCAWQRAHWLLVTEEAMIHRQLVANRLLIVLHYQEGSSRRQFHQQAQH